MPAPSHHDHGAGDLIGVFKHRIRRETKSVFSSMATSALPTAFLAAEKTASLASFLFQFSIAPGTKNLRSSRLIPPPGRPISASEAVWKTKTSSTGTLRRCANPHARVTASPEPLIRPLQPGVSGGGIAHHFCSPLTVCNGYSTSILRAFFCASSVFGMVSVSTPSLNCALTSSSFTEFGTRKLRRTEP